MIEEYVISTKGGVSSAVQDLGDLRQALTDLGVVSYQIEPIVEANAKRSFKGARVLEIGGHNIPRAAKFDLLGAEQWICCDLVGQGSGNYQAYDPLPSSTLEGGVVKFNQITKDLMSKKSAFLVGDAADLPAVLADRFDIIISIAAFEHMSRLPNVLSKCDDALVAGGMLFSKFAPIWSAGGGHHCNDPRIMRYNAIGKWDHLLLSQPQIYKNLVDAGVTPFMAAHTVAWIFTNPALNRLFYEDYVDYMCVSEFKDYELRPTSHAVPLEVHGQLRRRYPDYSRFDVYGIQITGWKR